MVCLLLLYSNIVVVASTHLLLFKHSASAQVKHMTRDALHFMQRGLQTSRITIVPILAQLQVCHSAGPGRHRHHCKQGSLCP
jgi:hypothetical protein